MKTWNFLFSNDLSINILILIWKLLVYLEFLQVSILSNIFRNDFERRVASPDDLLSFIHLWYFW